MEKILTPTIDDNNQTVQVASYNCTRFSSNSYNAFFSARYIKNGNGGTLEYIQYTEAKAEPSTPNETKNTVYNL